MHFAIYVKYLPKVCIQVLKENRNQLSDIFEPLAADIEEELGKELNHFRSVIFWPHFFID